MIRIEEMEQRLLAIVSYPVHTCAAEIRRVFGLSVCLFAYHFLACSGHSQGLNIHPTDRSREKEAFKWSTTDRNGLSVVLVSSRRAQHTAKMELVFDC